MLFTGANLAKNCVRDITFTPELVMAQVTKTRDCVTILGNGPEESTFTSSYLGHLRQ